MKKTKTAILKNKTKKEIHSLKMFSPKMKYHTSKNKRRFGLNVKSTVGNNKSKPY